MNDITPIIKEVCKYLNDNMHLISSYSGYETETQDGATTHNIHIECKTLESSAIVKNRINSITENCIIEELGMHRIDIRRIQWDFYEKAFLHGKNDVNYAISVCGDSVEMLPMIDCIKTQLISKHLERHVLPPITDNEYCKIIRAGLAKSIDDTVKYRGIIDMELRYNVIINNEYHDVLNRVIQDLYNCNFHIGIDYELNITDVYIDHINSTNMFIGFDVKLCIK